MLASHPAERSIAPKPASLARLEPWGSLVASHGANSPPRDPNPAQATRSCPQVLGEQQGRDPWQAPGKEHAVANTPGCVGLGDFPQKEVWKERSGLQWKGRGAQRYLTEVKPAGRGNPQVCDTEPLDQVTMEIVLRRKKKTQQPRHILVTPKETAGAAERGRGTGRGASPGPARSFFPPWPGRASPPRAAAAAEQPAGRASPPRRAAGSESASSLAAASRPGRRVALFPQPRSWNLKTQTPRGVWGRVPSRSARRAPTVSARAGWTERARREKFPAGTAAGAREDLPRPPLRNAGCKERPAKHLLFSLSPGEQASRYIPTCSSASSDRPPSSRHLFSTAMNASLLLLLLRK
ncbi:uncharacterized protein LOC125106984 [Lutra lutra]|uniref:uncharacterized protein LOC125106984 n=1 Tax=Lutra lutra TaxID=9657 RepID=UPI001FD13899|nr:uncharacterized protein LOC125106984 [Lutra lutra]